MTEQQAKEGLSGMVVFFRDVLPRLDKLTKYELRLLILTIGLYLYCRYFKSGILKKNGDSDYYTINAGTMNKIYEDKDIVKLAKSVVMPRNRVAHATWSVSTDKAIKSVLESTGFRKLLVYENLINEDGEFIEPEGGSYTISDRIDIIKKIDNNDTDNTKGSKYGKAFRDMRDKKKSEGDVDKINDTDKVITNSNSTYFDAVNKMGGDNK